MDQLPQPYEVIMNNKQQQQQQDSLNGGNSQQQISQSVNYSLDQQNILQEVDGTGSASPGGQGSNSKGSTIQMRNNRLGKNPSYGRIRAQASSQAQVAHGVPGDLGQSLVKVKNPGPSSGLGLYYKNPRPAAHNINSF